MTNRFHLMALVKTTLSPGSNVFDISEKNIQSWETVMQRSFVVMYGRFHVIYLIWKPLM